MYTTFSNQIHQICLDSLNTYINVPLIFYSHLPIAFISFVLGIFVLLNSKTIVGKAFFSLTSVFSFFILCNFATWLSTDSLSAQFLWSLFGLLISSIFILNFYFAYVFLFNKDMTLKVKCTTLFFYLPILLITPTYLSIKYFDSINCFPIENIYYMSYYYIFGVASFIIILVMLYLRNKKVVDVQEKKKNIMFVVGIEIFTLLFVFSSFFVSYLNDTGYLTSYDYEQYGFIGALVFMIIIAYLIVKFKAFNIKMVGAQALVWALVILIGSEFLFVNDITNQILVAVTLIISSILGLILVRSVKKEVALRENVEKLAGDLKKANTRLLELDKQKSEFVSFATHQLRAPLTAMKGYASLILEGDLGVLNDKVRDAITRISNSSKTLTNIVDDYLNISRIELGTMKYSFEVMDFKDIVTHVIAELKPNIDKSGLKFNFSTNPLNPQERFMIHADRDKFKQVIANLIDNSMKYTRSGSIEVLLSKNNANRKITFSIKDTGIGISPEVMPKLFVKFVRADNANKQNIYGTGLGLYVAKDIITSHKGKIWAESDGDGKGSTFLVEMDMEV